MNANYTGQAEDYLEKQTDKQGEEEAAQILLYAKESFILKRKTWDDIEEDEPAPDEIAAFNEYRAAKITNE